ncbi:MAG: nuclear transport factor 2 family protein [Proteobacteria bacterium]|nr:nuclear transport factor 2 family protein [Pseudomonadota bacterium]
MSQADELQIRNLVARYSDAVNRRDADAWGDTWAQDGTWRILGQAPQGRETIVKLWEQLMSGFPFVVQLPSEGVVEISGSEASGRFPLSEFGRGPDGRGVFTLGIYHDRLRRDDDGWRFSERRFQVLYSGPPDLSAEPAPRGEGDAP